MNLDPSHVITLMTDFGTSDHYVGVMKGVMSEYQSTSPDCRRYTRYSTAGHSRCCIPNRFGMSLFPNRDHPCDSRRSRGRQRTPSHRLSNRNSLFRLPGQWDFDPYPS